MKVSTSDSKSGLKITSVSSGKGNCKSSRLFVASGQHVLASYQMASNDITGLVISTLGAITLIKPLA